MEQQAVFVLADILLDCYFYSDVDEDDVFKHSSSRGGGTLLLTVGEEPELTADDR